MGTSYGGFDGRSRAAIRTSKDVCLGIRLSTETKRKDVGAVKVRIKFQKGEAGYYPVALRNIPS
jgi:hypothetical protein